MSDDFLSRWSRRKIEARKQDKVVVPVETGSEAETEKSLDAPVEPAPPPEPLPPVESLTPESDFTPFMKAEVDPQVKRDALKALFQDPRYNVMDGLDVYIDDYSKPDPLPDGWLEQMTQFARLGDYKPPVEEAAEGVPKIGAEPEEVIAKHDVDSLPPPHPDGAQELSPPPPESKPS